MVLTRPVRRSAPDPADVAIVHSSDPDGLIVPIDAPIGKAKPVLGKLKPQIACPTI